MRNYRHISISIILLMLMTTVMIGLSGCDSDAPSDPDQSTSTLPVSPAEQSGEPANGMASLPISDEDIEKAATAHKDITRINQNLQQAVQQTENMDERRKLQIKANEDMVRAAESAGLDFKAYNHIMQQVRSNTQMEMLFQEKLKSLE